MSQINSKIEDDFQIILLQLCIVEHPVHNTKQVCNEHTTKLEIVKLETRRYLTLL